jgi:hypothetical protein
LIFAAFSEVSPVEIQLPEILWLEELATDTAAAGTNNTA